MSKKPATMKFNSFEVLCLSLLFLSFAYDLVGFAILKADRSCKRGRGEGGVLGCGGESRAYIPSIHILLSISSF